MIRCLVALVFLLLPLQAPKAAIVTYTFGGILVENYGTASSGTAFSGSFSYDDTQPDQAGLLPTIGLYDFLSFDVTVGTEVISMTDGGLDDRLTVDNGTGTSDGFSIASFSVSGSVGGIVPEAVSFQLIDDTATVFSDDSLPGGDLLLSSFSSGTFILGLNAPVAGGQVQRLAPVPLPAALPLFLSALTGLGLLRWRRPAHRR